MNQYDLEDLHHRRSYTPTTYGKMWGLPMTSSDAETDLKPIIIIIGVRIDFTLRGPRLGRKVSFLRGK